MSPIEEFSCLLKESNQFPKDELRDYYLVPAKALISSNSEIANQVHNDKTALFMVVEQLIRKNNHSIREIHLNELAFEVIERTPKNILNFQNQDGNSVIHLTTERECFSVGVLDLMKEMGANFSLINKNGQTPLIKVASTDSLDDLKFIHAYTSPRLLNHKDFITGSSALMTAVKEKKINNVFFLLEVGCDLFIRDNSGRNIIEIYKSQEYKDSCEPSYYKELDEIIELFYLKQKTEQTLKKLSSGS